MTAPDKGRVLVVDDEAAFLQPAQELLEQEGYQVEAATDGQAALGLILGGDFDAVLSDVNMPGLSGIELLRRVRERDLDVPVILMTGDARVEVAAEAVEHGALRYLLKPFTTDALRRAVEHAVRLRRLASAKREALAHLGLSDRMLGDRTSLEAAFARALGSLWLAYQPIVSAEDRRVFGHEALVRCREPYLPHPGALFDAAQRLRRVLSLGQAIREEAARSQRPEDHGMLFINVHPTELQQAGFEESFSPLSALAPQVVLEITERHALESITDLRQRIQALRGLGFRIALDDLGAGYAGLTSFATLAPDVVKLDRVLVHDVDREPLKRKLIESMVALSKELGIRVVAEGVETEAELAVLVGVGCDLLQGYLLGRPAGRHGAR